VNTWSQADRCSSALSKESTHVQSRRTTYSTEKQSIKEEKSAALKTLAVLLLYQVAHTCELWRVVHYYLELHTSSKPSNDGKPCRVTSMLQSRSSSCSSLDGAGSMRPYISKVPDTGPVVAELMCSGLPCVDDDGEISQLGRGTSPVVSRLIAPLRPSPNKVNRLME